MKNYFAGLFQYDHHCNQLMIDLLLTTGLGGKAVDLMAHTFKAQQIWLYRCRQMPLPAIELWAAGNVNQLTTANNAGYRDWMAYLDTLGPADFDSVVNYNNLKGVPFSDPLIDILAHVINHGTHHRAQVGQYLKEAGAELPATDYIHYIRNNKPSIPTTT